MPVALLGAALLAAWQIEIQGESIAYPTHSDESIDVIAFGSCAREERDQPIWEHVLAAEPDLFLFIGDNMYADIRPENGKEVMRPVTDAAEIAAAYQALAAQPNWQRLRRRCAVLATWDDHDYGANDMGNDFPLRRESQQLFMDFYGVPAQHPMRSQAGVYHAATFGPEDRRVQVILLDTRYHRDALDRKAVRDGLGPYAPTNDTGRTMLGEAQWAWLREQLLQPARVRIVASSVQVVAWEHGFETWGNMPHERERLYRLIDETGAGGVLFVSGDRHLMEISVARGAGVPYPMWDFTSSGINQGAGEVRDPNSFRVGPVERQPNFGIVRIQWSSVAGNDRPTATAIHLEGYGANAQLLTRQTVWLDELAK